MELILLGVLAFASYKAFRFVTIRMGAEAVRAYVYLELLNIGETADEANFYADRAVTDTSSSLMRKAIEQADYAYRMVHSGKKLPVIGRAYRDGMQSTMPVWYRTVALAAPDTLSVEVSYGRLRPPPQAGAFAPTAHAGPSKYNTYEEYHAAFLIELQKSFTDDEEVRRVVNAMHDDRIRAGYDQSISPVAIANQYRDFLGSTVLYTSLRD
ncbi:hypothetical protein LJR231_002065 [Phyllobacterium sp. LjRoot231]|uniref:hypothetical protein n=1 Tax=Phyllobacterium sp. LjRoot231 TaxID=3342289 RepID=UPI003ED0F3FD